jgi:hypothetical protein
VGARIEIGGVVCEWSSPNEEALESWLSRAPWTENAGTRTIALTGLLSRTVILPWIEARIDAIASHVGGVSTRILEIRDESVRIESVLAEGVGVASDVTRQSLLASLHDECEVRPYVFVLDGAAQLATGRLADEADGLLSDYWKTAPEGTRLGPAICIISDRLNQTGIIDLRSLEPRPPATWLDGTSSEAWKWYLHLRIAWEAGGDLELAVRWGGELRGLEIAPPNDTAFELWLDERAVQAFLSLQPAVRERLRAQPVVSDQPAFTWYPLGGAVASLRPWVARAVRHLSPRSDDGTRHPLNCLYVARDLFCRLLDIEWRTRQSLELKPGAILSPKAEQDYKLFCAGSQRSPAFLYPSGSPATPSEKWSFASFGEVLNSLADRHVAIRPRLYALLGLRNALAHGHYNAWAAISRYRELRDIC